jgi:predicted nucleic acid-binding protein
MYFVVDTNVLFSFFKENSATHRILSEMQLGLFAPEYALAEIKEHAGEIRKKTGISTAEFSEVMKRLVLIVEFVPISDYADSLKEAAKTARDKDDIDFFALALKLELPIWTNDAGFKQQKKVAVIETGELIRLIKP